MTGVWPAGRLKCQAAAPTVDVAALEAAEELEEEVCLASTLAPGQSFAWKRIREDAWLGTLGGSALLLQQSTSNLRPRWRTLAGPAVTAQQLRCFFGLEAGAPALGTLHATWGKSCPRLAEVARCLPWLRVLQQDLAETVVGFICSQNNNVSRICLLMDRLRARYGRLLCRLRLPTSVHAAGGLQHEKEFHQCPALYAFPDLEVLAAVPAQTLRKLGLGYRAAYLRGAAKKLLEQDCSLLKWLEACREPEHIDPFPAEEPEQLRARRLEIRRQLCLLPGVGSKVADCIALFALRQHGAVPVDVHVWRIVTRDYEPELREAKSLTPPVYERVGEAFRRRFGAFAGWAHSLLFGAEFGELRRRLPPEMLKDMDDFREEVKQQKAKRKRERSNGQEVASPKVASPKVAPKRSPKQAQKRPATKKSASGGPIGPATWSFCT
ncbi:unnamed protein product [Effrenium voratum]|nr:unnamed protein product [Effrenium voratum]